MDILYQFYPPSIDPPNWNIMLIIVPRKGDTFIGGFLPSGRYWDGAEQLLTKDEVSWWAKLRTP